MKNILIVLIIFAAQVTFGQTKHTISGYVKDAASGETVIGANIYLKDNPNVGTTSNYYGFYSLTLDEGNYNLVCSYIGFQNAEQKISLTNDITVDLLISEGVVMEEIVVSSEDPKQNVESTQMGTLDISAEQVKKLPALFGEVDILKVVQLLPGVSSATEGTAGLYVRGGGPDQNLVLLDEAVVYNTGHLLGFFSVFNADAIKNVELIKGSMPANYGGRISSVLDVSMKEGNDKDYIAEGGIGIISSRLTVQGPIVKEKSSFILSGRRTYVLDLAQPFIKNTDFAGTNYYFYDLNAKVNYRLSQKDRLYASGYFGRDVFSFSSGDRAFKVNLPYGNSTGTLRWNRVIRNNLFMNIAAVYNDYSFEFKGGQEDFSFQVFSGVRDYSLKADFDYYPNPNHHIMTGVKLTAHKLTPNIVEASNGETTFASNFTPKYGYEYGPYILDDWKINSSWKINAGLYCSFFTQSGPYISPFDNTAYKKSEIVKTYVTPEPRISFNYAINSTQSIKGGITYAGQYIHLVSNSGSTLPADTWVPSTELIKPQKSIQYALGYYRNFADDTYESSVEVYFKDMYNQLDYRESYVENFSADLENQFVAGKGKAYGVEFYVKKKYGRLNGWLGYTLARTERSYAQIEQGRVFPATYDRPHDIVAVINYQLTNKWNFSSSFIYASGKTFTPIEKLFLIENNINVEYGPRNSSRLDAYHRMDVALTYDKHATKNKAFHSNWVFSVYNVYNRKNPFFTYTTFETNVERGSASAKAYKVTIFPIIPSVTWNFFWNVKKSKNT